MASETVFLDEGVGRDDDAVSRRILPLPMYPELSDEQLDYVRNTVVKFFN